MLIDWFTVIAQTFNFLILVWLMKRFLYQPVLNAIDAREKRIAAELAEAADQKAEAAKERAGFQQRNADFDRQRKELLNKAIEESDAERQRLLAQARIASDDLIAKRRLAITSEAEALNQTLARRAQDEVFSIARKTLSDLAGYSLEERIVTVFLQRLSEMGSETKTVFKDALIGSSVRLASAFELSANQRNLVQQAVNEAFSSDIPLTFDTAPDLIGGIELQTGGRKIGWSISDYLRSLEKSVGEVLAQQAPAGVS